MSAAPPAIFRAAAKNIDAPMAGPPYPFDMFDAPRGRRATSAPDEAAIPACRNFAVLYSLVGSCIANGVEPTEYLTDVLARVRDATTDEQLDALLPDRWQPVGPAP
jgi:hypothetical protein